MKLTTTLNKIRACSPCGIKPNSDGTLKGFLKLRSFVGEGFDADAEINILTVLESNGVQDALWCLRATHQDSRKIASQFAIEFAELSLCHFERKYPNDKRPHEAIQAARDFDNGKITVEVLREKRAAAAYAAAAAAAAAAYAAAAADASAAAAAAAADAADAAYAAAAYADAAADASAARQKMLDKQAEIIRMILEK